MSTCIININNYYCMARKVDTELKLEVWWLVLASLNVFYLFQTSNFTLSTF